MNYEERRPSVALAPYVKCIWQLRRSYRADEIGEVLWPDGCQELIFHYGASYLAAGQPLPRAFFIGMLSHYHHLHADGELRLFGVRLLPWGLAALSDKPMGTAQSLLEQFLLDVYEPDRVDPAMASVLAKLYGEPMEYDVGRAAQESGYSQRQFERRCAELTGLSPKRLHKTARFNQARLRLMFQPDLDLHECMLEFGYYDYAHFSKDFKLSLGITPAGYRKWIREMAAKMRGSQDVVFYKTSLE